MQNTLFFFASKIIWALISPGSLLFLILLSGIVLLFLGKLSAAKIILGVGGIMMALVTFLPLGTWLVTPLETRFPTNPELPSRIHGIILLGGTVDPVTSYIWDQPQFGSSAERYHAFIQLAREHRRAKLVFTGGAGSLLDQQYKEADIARYFLHNMGISENRLEFERDSRNTYENAVNSKALVAPQPDENWILITSAGHMPRSVGIFCQLGWPVIPWPVDHQSEPGFQTRLTFELAGNLSSLNQHSREWIGLFAYFITGKTGSLLPGGCRS